MELVIDHVMFPVYLGGETIDVIQEVWESHGTGRVFSQPANPSFRPIYYRSKSFYIEYAANVRNEPYWSNAVYLVVPTEFWDHYETPALRNDHFLIPAFGSGYQLVSPDFPHLNSKLPEPPNDYDGFTLLISAELEREITTIGGQKWTLPADGRVRVHPDLHHLHDIAVINEKGKIVAPILEANPILREYL